jgi:hypothetical protein
VSVPPTAATTDRHGSGVARRATAAMAATTVTVPDGKLTTSAKVRPTTGFITQSHAATARTGPTSSAMARGRLRRTVARKPATAAATTTNGDPIRVNATSRPEWWTGRIAAKAHRSNTVGPGRTLKYRPPTTTTSRRSPPATSSMRARPLGITRPRG